jgi:uncharacterized damage-inducible protein DinB
MDGKEAVRLIRQERHFLHNILNDFREEHSNFKPTEEMRTVGQQIEHIALSTNFFYESAFGSGFKMSFPQYLEEMKKIIGLEKALKDLDEAYEEAISLVENKTHDEMEAPIPPNPMLGDFTCKSIIYRSQDHTAHHRGMLAVYLRLLGIKPTMVYA